MKFCKPVAALLILAVLPGSVGAQFRIPIRVPVRVPLRAPVHVPHVPIPHSVPLNSPAQAAKNGQNGGDNSAYWNTAGLIAGFVALVGGGVFWFLRVPTERIRVTGTPAGDAPEAVRRAWVGLELPLPRGEARPKLREVVGAVSDAEAGSTVGFAVEGRVAIRRLAKQAPLAAEWWRANVPGVEDADYQFLFPAATCEKVT